MSDREMLGMTHEYQGGWRKSSRSASGTGGNCVEVAFVADKVGVRDSKNISGPRLSFPGTTWRAFVDHR
jgi:hypothetical protein